MTTTNLHRGAVLARLLRWSWRTDVPPAALSEAELDGILPLVKESGTAGLAWRRIRNTELAGSEAGRSIQVARLSMAAVTAIRASQLERLLGVADQNGPLILLKGWDHARLYPAPGLRPYGDFDLVTIPNDNDRAPRNWETLTQRFSQADLPVDLHDSLVDLPDRSWAEIRGRSRPGPSESARVRVLGPEDDLRLSCLHLVRHAIEMPPRTNPFWLCDLGVMLENLPPEFDWAYCLSGQPWRTQWMLAVIRLANELLGVNVDRCPRGMLPASVPSWMTKSFIRLWGRGERQFLSAGFPLPFGHVRRDIRLLPRSLAERWPSPLQGVFRLSWPVTPLNGPVAQVVDYTARAVIWGTRA
jgi:Uncharacterised nucleotidyltransferase